MTAKLLLRHTIVLGIFLATLGACTTMQTNQVTVGQGLLDLGSQFLSTAKLYDEAYTQKLITREQYNTFAEFAHYFQLSYAGAAKAYQAGTSSPTELRKVIQELNDELTLYALTQVKK